MWLPRLILWTKRGMAYLYLSTPKGQTVAFILCTKAASAFAISVFNPLVSRELLRWLCILLIYWIILVRGDFIFLWTGKKKTRGVFEVSVTEIRCYQELKSPKHQINYFSKENLNLDRQVPGPHGGPALWGTGCWDRGWGRERQRQRGRFVLSFPGHLASEWSEMLSNGNRNG